MEKTNLLHQIPLFKKLTSADLQKLNEIVMNVTFDKGQRIFTEGSPGDSLFVINSGLVKVFKKGRVENVFDELVYLPKLIKDSNFSLDVLLIHSEEVLIDDGLGSWRRRKWSVHDRHLLKVVDNVLFNYPLDFLTLLPENLPVPFTVAELAKELRLKPSLAQKMVYCLSKMGVIKFTGKRGKAFLYIPQ